MKVKKFTMTTAQINAGTVVQFDLSYTDTAGYIYYPKAIQYTNNTNAVIEFLYLANSDEVKELTTIPLYYEYLQLPTGNSIADLPVTQYLNLKKLSGTAIADLTFYAYNYSTWKR
jgi:hypothetical protein